MSQVGTRPWDLEPGPKGELRGALTTKLCFRMIAQAVGTGSPAGNAARRDPAQCSRGWACAVSKVEQKELTVPFKRW